MQTRTSSGDTEKFKSHSDFFVAALPRLRGIHPEDVIVIGDMANEVQADRVAARRLAKPARFHRSQSRTGRAAPGPPAEISQSSLPRLAFRHLARPAPAVGLRRSARHIPIGRHP